jgi:Ala-tRNA(Pro) deacylase
MDQPRRHGAPGRPDPRSKEAAMSIPQRLTTYLDQLGLTYEVRAHEHSNTSAQSARTAHVMLHHLAKPVLLEDEAGCVMAVVPADRSVRVGKLAEMLGRHGLHLADEDRIAALFSDCARGALPPIGMAWGIDTIVDDELEASDVVYLEAGDHESLLKMSRESFHALVSKAQHGRICREKMH